MAHEILVSAQGPLVFGFRVWGLRVWGQGLTIPLMRCKSPSEKVLGLKYKFYVFMIFPLVYPLVKWTL